jgi:hypothetical protein
MWPGRQNYLVNTASGFNLSRLLLDNIRVRLNAAAAMGRAGQWKSQQNEHVAEGKLAVDCDYRDPPRWAAGRIPL